MTSIFVPPVCRLEELNHIFIELTQKNCNQRCRKCYIDFPLTKNVKDFIQIDKIKQALNDTKDADLKCLYLTGAEPMTHPDFNNILRLCLKRTNVCIFTNATFINEKKARFLKKVEDESSFQIIFKLSFAHSDEFKNDEVRFRGAFRQNMYALKCLDKYDFTTIMCVNNYYNEDEKQLVNDMNALIQNSELHNTMVQVTEWSGCSVSSGIHTTDGVENYSVDNVPHTYDCSRGRLLTQNGIFSCPFLTNDYRGRMGSDFKDFSTSVRLETDFCSSCIKNKDPMFSINIS